MAMSTTSALSAWHRREPPPHTLPLSAKGRRMRRRSSRSAFFVMTRRTATATTSPPPPRVVGGVPTSGLPRRNPRRTLLPIVVLLFGIIAGCRVARTKGEENGGENDKWDDDDWPLLKTEQQLKYWKDNRIGDMMDDMNDILSYSRAAGQLVVPGRTNMPPEELEMLSDIGRERKKQHIYKFVGGMTPALALATGMASGIVQGEDTARLKPATKVGVALTLLIAAMAPALGIAYAITKKKAKEKKERLKRIVAARFARKRKA